MPIIESVAMAVVRRVRFAMPLIALSVSFALTSNALAQSNEAWPGKPVKLMVGYAAGSSTDVVGRLIASKLTEYWKQSVVVENRGGAAGNIAADLVAKSTADGYTLLIAQNGLAISVAANPKLPFDGLKDLLPIAPVAATSHLLIVNNAMPVKTVQELIAMAKAEPGKLTFASSGNGNSDHLAGEMFKVMAGVDAVHVPYRGGSLAATDVLGGQISYYFSGMPVGLPHAKAGKVRALAVTGKQRVGALPDVPTMAESGMPDYEVLLWQGIFAPAGTPKAIVDRVAADVARALASADLKERMESAGVQTFSATPERFADYYRAEIAKWGRIVKAASLKLE